MQHVPPPVRIGHIAPFFIVADVQASVDFYVRALGFELRHLAPEDDPFFAIVGRDAAQVYLKAILPEVRPEPNHTRHPWAPWDAFVHVADPDALAAEFRARGVALHRDLADTDDGLRGFEVRDRDGYALFFGRPR